jgi:hypothetical protein
MQPGNESRRAASANERVQLRKARCTLHGTFARHGNRTTGAGIAQRVVDRFAFLAARHVRGAEAVAGASGVDLADRERRYVESARPVIIGAAGAAVLHDDLSNSEAE